MNGKRYPTQKEINELYEYNSETGLFIYKRRESVRECWNSTYAGKIAGSIDEKGYVRISVNKKFVELIESHGYPFMEANLMGKLTT